MERTTVSCSFSIFDEGRKYTGNHRQYLVENARAICYSPATKEKIKLREALGYYGHGRRILSGKVSIQEIEAVTLPDGTQAVISNIPSNVTLAFDVAHDGTVTHAQEILDTEPGRIVTGLHNSKIGGFSWACNGQDPKGRGPTRLSGFCGFDYVLNPNFSANRGYILESASGSDSADSTKQAILESIAATIGNDTLAEQYVSGWNLDHQFRIGELEDSIFESESREAEANQRLRQQNKIIEEMEREKGQAILESAKIQENYKELLKTVSDSFPFFIPEHIMHEMLEGDFNRAKGIFEQASLVDFSAYPIDQGRKGMVLEAARHRKPTPSDYGSAMFGFGIGDKITGLR